MKNRPKNQSNEINGITFSPREVDVLSCIVTGRTSRKSIASALNVSTTTVASYIRSIMQKLSCSSWENIRGFVENAGAADTLRQHFKHLNDPEVENHSLSTLCHDQVENVADGALLINQTFYFRFLYSTLQKSLSAYLILIVLSLAIVLLCILFYKNTVETSLQSDLLLPQSEQLILRNKMQANITQHLNRSKSPQFEIPIVTLIGIGGSGKTTLARMIARNQTGVVWEINAETLDSLKLSYISLAYALAQNREDREKINFIMGLPAGKIRDANLISYLKEHLRRRKKRWCLLFDNVESLKQIQEFIPQNPKIWGHGKIIITTRNQNCMIGKTVACQELSKEEQLQLFQKVTSINTTRNANTEMFLSKLPPYPLDIVVAGKYVKGTKTNFNTYLGHLRPPKLGHEEQRFLVDRELGYAQTRYDIVNSSIKEILNQIPGAKKALFALCLVDSQNIPKNFLKALCKEGEWEQLLFLLRKYSLIISESNVNSVEVISLHRSIQKIILKYLKNLLGDKIFENTLLEIAYDMAAYTKKTIFLIEDFELARLIEVHIKALLSKIDKSDLSWIIVSLQYLNLSATLVQTSLLSFQEFKELAELTISKLEMQKSHLRLIDQVFLFRLLYGEVLYLQGEYIYALPQIESAYKHFKNKDSKSLDYFKSVNRLANLYRLLGQFNNALKYLEEAKKLSFIHSEQWLEYSNYLLIQSLYLRDIGNYKESQILLKKSQKIVAMHKPNCMFATPLEHYLGVSDIELGYYDSAVKRGYQLERGLFALDKRYPGFVYIYLGKALLLQGKLKNASDVLHKAKRICHEQKYEHNINYIRSLLPTLGQLYLLSKKYAESKEILLQAHSLLLNHYGANHFMIARVKASLGELALAEGHLEEAESHLQESLALLKSINHTDMYIPLEALAKLLHTRYLRAQAQKQSSKQIKQNYRELRNHFLLKAYILINERFPLDSTHVKRISHKITKYRVKISFRGSLRKNAGNYIEDE